MPSVTYDGRSFMIDGRRIWLVSGSIHYTRIPRELWEDRIWAARLAGLNCIETPVFWNRCEPRPGQFDFSGDNDIRHFIELIGKAGMYCILRPGPFVGAEWDMGGLPPWLLAVKNIRLRTNNQPFLEASSRYITALSDQVRDLQMTQTAPASLGAAAASLHGGGPIVLIQNEMHWTSGDDKEADTYLGELARYLRESGFNIPTINSNNLWQGVEGEIDGWAAPSSAGVQAEGGGVGGGGAGSDLLAILRQLSAVRPDQPRMVIDFDIGAPAVWGVPGSHSVEHPAVLVQRMAQVLVAGGQFNLNPFCGGTNFGFWGGRLPHQPRAYVAASRDHGAPLSETGQPGPAYSAVRRLCAFASRFGRVFANLDPSYRPVVLAPAQARGDDVSAGAMSLVYASGPQGNVAFIFAPPLTDARGEGAARSYSLVLADGASISVPIGSDGLAWCLFDAFLGGRARLDYCGLCAFGLLGKVLVVFGPSGSAGELSINGSPLHVQVPKGRAGPAIVEHESIFVVVCSEEQIDHAFITDDAIYLGCAGLTREGEPIALPGARQCTRISGEGVQTSVPAIQNGAHGGAASGAGDKVAISDWMVAATAEYSDGTSARFAVIDGPADLTTLGSPYGYGWYRLRFKSNLASKARLAVPHGADRLHLFIGGESIGILGFGPGASPDLPVSMKRGNTTVVILAENLGRLSGGIDLGEPKGVYGDLWQVEPVKTGKPAFKTADPVDVLSVRSPLFEVQPGDITHPERITWTIQHRRKTGLIISINAFPGRGILIVNDTPISFIDRGGGSRYMIDHQHLRNGNNIVQVAVLPDHGGDQHELDELLASLAAPGALAICEAVQSLSSEAEWAFAKWEMPRPTAYQKNKPAAVRGTAVWWRAHFRPGNSPRPLLFDAAGLTKGQLYINQRHICRYFVATGDGKHVPPQQMYYIPAPWLRPDEENELLIFDEHGGSPSKCRLLYENERGS